MDVLLIENASVIHRFNRTNLERANQRYLEYDLLDLVQQIADQSFVRLATFLSVTTSTRSIELISIKNSLD